MQAIELRHQGDQITASEKNSHFRARDSNLNYHGHLVISNPPKTCLEINLHIYGQLIFDKGAKNLQQRKQSYFYNSFRKFRKPHPKE